MALSGPTNIIIISTVFPCLALLAVLLRFRARVVQGAALQADDYLIIPGLIFSLGLGAAGIVAAALGNLGGHVALGADNAPKFDASLVIYKRTDFAVQLISIVALAFTQLSILFFYRRIFKGAVFSVVTIVMIVLVCIWGVSFFLADLLQCRPISEVWESWEGQEGHIKSCYNYIPMFYGTAISHMIMDLLILSIPLPMVWKLQNRLLNMLETVKTKQKIAVCGIFLLGAFVVGISISRVYFFFSVGKEIERAWDITYVRAPTDYWSMLEAQFAVICACLPTLRVLFTDISLEGFVKIFASKISLFSGMGSFQSSPRSTEAQEASSISSARGLQDGYQMMHIPSAEDGYKVDLFQNHVQTV